MEKRLCAARGGQRRDRNRAVYHVWHQLRRHQRRIAPGTLFLGPSATAEEIKQVFENCKLRFQHIRSQDQVLATAVSMLNDQKIVAWMHGRMEFGPRALGNRSILASPLDPYSTENLNVYIKHREPFRKFAASVPAEVASKYFDVGSNARNLATMGRVRPEHKKTFAAAILGDDMIRAHVVHEADNPLYHRLLLEAGKANGLPVLYNTSFNLFGDPLVSTPRDAVRKLLLFRHRRDVRGQLPVGKIDLVPCFSATLRTNTHTGGYLSYVQSGSEHLLASLLVRAIGRRNQVWTSCREPANTESVPLDGTDGQ